MDNNENKTICLDTPDQIAMARMLTVRSGLRMEARGMRMSRGASCLKIAREEGWTNKRNAKAALEDMNALLADFDANK